MNWMLKELKAMGAKCDSALKIARELEKEAVGSYNWQEEKTKREPPPSKKRSEKVLDAKWHDSDARPVGTVRFERVRLEYQTISESRYMGYRNPARYFLDPRPKGRGLTMETCKAWDLGDDPVFGRALFPVRDVDGFLVVITGRLYKTACKCGMAFKDMVDPVTGKSTGKCPRCRRRRFPKYLHSKGSSKELFLFGEHMLNPKLDYCYLVESHMDVLSMWQMGYPNTLATMGTFVSAVQIEKVVKWFESAILVSHGDKPGDNMALLVKEMVNDRIMLTEKRCDENEDPDSTGVKLIDMLGAPPGIDRSIRTAPKGIQGSQERIVFYG